MDLSVFLEPKVLIGLLTLTLLEIVLGIDNIIFISILSGKLPPELRPKARQVGIGVAMISRILLLLAIGWVMSLNRSLFHLFGDGVTGRDIILVLGGFFLVGKATVEIHAKLEGAEHRPGATPVAASFFSVIAMIMMVDIVFSIDSVITAVGMVRHVEVMIAAVLISVAFMLIFVNPISNFVDRHPTVKMLALAFLVLIGVNLMAEGFGQHIEKGYTYAAMGFAVFVEALNLRLRRTSEPPVQLKQNFPLVGELEAAGPDADPARPSR
jgi:predicted tellurium resistance membrane protein TerC